MSKYNPAINDDGVNGTASRGQSQLMYGIDTWKRLRAVGAANHNIGALSWLYATDFVLKTGGACGLDGLHLNDGRRGQRLPAARRDEVCTVTRIANEAVDCTVGAKGHACSPSSQLRQPTRRLFADPELKIGGWTPHDPRIRLHNEWDIVFIHHIHVDEAGIFAEHSNIGEMSDARLAKALTICARGCWNVTFVLMKHHVGLVSEPLCRTKKGVGRSAEAVGGDVAAHQRIGILIAVQLAPKLLEATLELCRRPFIEGAALERAQVPHNVNLVPDIASGQHAAHTNFLSSRGHGVSVEDCARFHKHCKSMPQHLKTGELGRNLLIVRGHVSFPVGEGDVCSRWLIEDSAARGVHDVVVRVNEAGMDCPATSVKKALRTPNAGDLRSGTNSGYSAIGEGDRTTFEDTPLRVNGDEAAICDEDVAAALARHAYLLHFPSAPLRS
jgi:hypothetical protein